MYNNNKRRTMNKKTILWAGAALMCMGAVPVNAQTSDVNPMIVLSSRDVKLKYVDTTYVFKVKANVEYTMDAPEADWITFTEGTGGRVSVSVQKNLTDEYRTAQVTFRAKEGRLERTYTVTQDREMGASMLPDTPDEAMLADMEVFADEMLSGLKPDVTQDRINAMHYDLFRLVAQEMFDGVYDTKYRLASYKCYTSPQTLSAAWNAPGKHYDQLAGVTGINIKKGSNAVIVSGIPEGLTVQLCVTAWYEGKDGGSFDGGNPQLFYYTLKNGLNVFEYNFDYDGLAYICYYAPDSSQYPDLQAHFVRGQVNGYLSPDKTNEEMYELCANAKNVCMDLLGTKVHSVWTSKGLRDYCKASDGTSLGYRQYMNVLDSLIAWEHRALGFEKYNRLPDTRTLAYTNYTYYMFQGGLGVSFHHDQEQRVLNCRTLMYNDDDAIWGLSHEWGHQHQMKPYFCWAGMSEVTNNVFSYYNIMAMGYTRSDKIRAWPEGRRLFIENVNSSGSSKAYGFNSSARYEAYKYRNELRSESLRAFAETMTDSMVTAVNKNPYKAISANECGVGETLASFIMLYNYFTYIKGYKDFVADWHEALRQSDDENGSQIEKQGEVDKYELICSAQNGNKNGKYAVLQSKYPNSCWVTEGYIVPGTSINQNSVPAIMNFVRKVSRLTGYNLFPYFEAWGHLRQIAMRIGDYGTFWYVMTPQMYDEFKADMDALVESGELQAMPEGMVREISYTKDIFEIEGREPGSPTTPPAIPN